MDVGIRSRIALRSAAACPFMCPVVATSIVIAATGTKENAMAKKKIPIAAPTLPDPALERALTGYIDDARREGHAGDDILHMCADEFGLWDDRNRTPAWLVRFVSRAMKTPT